MTYGITILSSDYSFNPFLKLVNDLYNKHLEKLAEIERKKKEEEEKKQKELEE